jgi:hypothetical protein
MVERIEHREGTAAVGAARVKKNYDTTAIEKGIAREGISQVGNNGKGRQRIAHGEHSARSGRFCLVNAAGISRKHGENTYKKGAPMNWMSNANIHIYKGVKEELYSTILQI